MMSNLNYYNKHRGNNKKKVLALIVILIVFGLSVFIISEYNKQPVSQSVEEKSISKSTGVVIGNSSDNIVKNSNKSPEVISSARFVKYNETIWSGGTISPGGLPSIADFNGDGNNEIAIPLNSVLYMIDRNGNTIWKHEFLSNMLSQPILGKNKDGSAFIAITSGDGFVYALNGKDGSLIWKFEEKKTNIALSPLVYDANSDGTDDIFVMGDSILYALNGENGNAIWSEKVSNDIASPILESKNYEIVIPSGDMNNRYDILFLNPLNGEEDKRIITVDDSIQGSPSTPALYDLNGDGKKDVIMAYGNNLYAYDGNDGKLLWKASMGGNIWTPPIIADVNSDNKPEAIVKTDAGKVIAFDGQNGNMIWFSDATMNQQASAIAYDTDIDSKKEIIFSNSDYSLNAADGQGKIKKVLYDRNMEDASYFSLGFAVGDLNKDGKVEIVGIRGILFL